MTEGHFSPEKKKWEVGSMACAAYTGPQGVSPVHVHACVLACVCEWQGGRREVVLFNCSLASALLTPLLW